MCIRDRFYLVDHGMECLEVQPPVARYLFDVVLFCQRPVATPYVGGDLRVPVYMRVEHLFELLAGKVVDLHRVHPPYLSAVGQLYGAHGLFLLAVVAPPYLALFPAADHEFVDMDRTVHGMVPARLHGLPDLVHEQAGGLFGDPEAYARISCRKALGGGRHLEADEKCLAHPEPYPMEECIGRGGLRMSADVAGPGEILALLGCAMTTSGTFEPVLPLDLRKIFLAVEVRFEAVGELYHVLALKNIHKILIFIDFKVMQLSTDLYKSLLF